MSNHGRLIFQVDEEQQCSNKFKYNSLWTFCIYSIFRTRVGFLKNQSGGIAQLGERLPCKQEVRGSTPLVSTTSVKSNRYRPRRENNLSLYLENYIRRLNNKTKRRKTNRSCNLVKYSKALNEGRSQVLRESFH